MARNTIGIDPLLIRTIVLVLVILCGCAGCGAPPQRAAATPTAPFTAKPVPVSGWTSTSSDNWCGYVFEQGDITGVRAQWTEPEVHGDPSSLVSAWIGIDGWDLDTLVQVGTNAQPYGTTSAHRIWYEMYDARRGATENAPNVTDQPSAAGDQIVASIELAGRHPDVWDIAIVDVTLKTGFSNIVRASFDTPRITADFIVEAPGSQLDPGEYDPLPQFSPVTFSDMQVRVRNDWVSAASLPALRVDMVTSGANLATAGPLASDSSFTVSHAR